MNSHIHTPWLVFLPRCMLVKWNMSYKNIVSQFVTELSYVLICTVDNSATSSNGDRQ